MPSIVFSTPAAVFDFKQLDPETKEHGLFIDDPAVLRTLDGLVYGDELFAEYLMDDDGTAAFADAVSGGLLFFSFDAASGQLMAHTEYALSRPLSPQEVDLLQDYTVGQWSDGIGSGFFQERMRVGLAPQVWAPEDEVLVSYK
jgi:hypothetical protein